MQRTRATGYSIFLLLLNAVTIATASAERADTPTQVAGFRLDNPVAIGAVVAAAGAVVAFLLPRRKSR